MAKRAAPYRIYDRDRRGHAWIDVRSIPGLARIREPLTDAAGRSVPYRDERTGRAPSRAAEEAATRRYQEIIRGRTVVATDRVLTALTDEEVVAVWLDAIETPTNKKSVETKTTYGRTWHAFFRSESTLIDGSPRWKGDRRTALERMVDDAAVYDYAMHRLTCVLKKTVRKELTALFELFRWAKVHRMIGVIPARPELPRKETGVRSGPQRAKPVHIEPEEARAIVDELPEWSDASRSKRLNQRPRAFRVRDVFDFMWEMTWRPSTIARLAVPRNWAPGRATVTLHDEDDKARYGREVTLTARARAILERCAPKEGIIFGEHGYAPYIKAAALKVLPKHKARDFARYDFRHGRITNLLELSGNLPGVGQVAGHLQATTTDGYVHAQKRQGDAVIAAADAAAQSSGEGTPGARALSPNDDPTVKQSGREDSNLRPLDPQRGRIAQDLGFIADGGDEGHANSRHQTTELDTVRARYGHGDLSDLDRALAIETCLWDAFDGFSLLHDDAEVES